MREQYIESKLVEGVKRMGGLCLKFTSPGNAGVPDRIVLLPDGSVRFVELKTEDGRLAPVQKAWLEKLKCMGFDAKVLYGMREVREYVTRLSEESGTEDH